MQKYNTHHHVLFFNKKLTELVRENDNMHSFIYHTVTALVCK